MCHVLILLDCYLHGAGAFNIHDVNLMNKNVYKKARSKFFVSDHLVRDCAVNLLP